MNKVGDDLRSMGFCSMVHTKEMYLQPTDLQGESPLMPLAYVNMCMYTGMLLKALSPVPRSTKNQLSGFELLM